MAYTRKQPVSFLEADKRCAAFSGRLRKKLHEQGITCDDSVRSFNNILVVCCQDAVLPESATETIREAVKRENRVIVVNVNDAMSDEYKWELMRSGIRDVVEANDRYLPVETLQAQLERWSIIDDILQSPEVQKNIIGSSPCWMNFLRNVTEIAFFSSSSILLQGESGTGKEVTASFIHTLDQRRHKRELVVLDCTTIVPELSGSEFYGHERGAFTNAVQSRDGAFALANGGSLFLDEIGELPIHLQAGLLRVIQEGSYKPVGGSSWNKTDFRLICATNRNLQEEIGGGRFRQDLYFRIATTVCTLPPLHKRREDIPALVEFFLQRELKTSQAPPIDRAVMHFLKKREYPGNIRELKQLVSRLAARYTGEGSISIGHIPEEEFAVTPAQAGISPGSMLEEVLALLISSGKDLAQIKDDVSSIALDVALRNSSGNMTLAAKKLNQTVRNLQKIRQKKQAGR